MDVHHLADRADAVRRIYVAVVILVIGHSPVSLVHIPERLQVVAVRTLGVDNLAEETLLGYVQAGDFKVIVAAVLQHHAVLAGALGGVHQVFKISISSSYLGLILSYTSLAFPIVLGLSISVISSTFPRNPFPSRARLLATPLRAWAP